MAGRFGTFLHYEEAKHVRKNIPYDLVFRITGHGQKLQVTNAAPPESRSSPLSRRQCSDVAVFIIMLRCGRCSLAARAQ